ncbi:MAG: hypothetical protein KC466_14555, partial [Myxococcales bacterium]|nr:hypothetical protein [Myxococcales bacterium]
DGNTVSGDGCSATCRTEIVCGNGRVDAGEQCDDGNLVGGDGCSAQCKVEILIGASYLPVNFGPDDTALVNTTLLENLGGTISLHGTTFTDNINNAPEESGEKGVAPVGDVTINALIYRMFQGGELKFPNLENTGITPFLYLDQDGDGVYTDDVDTALVACEFNDPRRVTRVDCFIPGGALTSSGVNVVMALAIPSFRADAATTDGTALASMNPLTAAGLGGLVILALFVVSPKKARRLLATRLVLVALLLGVGTAGIVACYGDLNDPVRLYPKSIFRVQLQESDVQSTAGQVNFTGDRILGPRIELVRNVTF